MNWTASPEPAVPANPSAPADNAPQMLVEEIACAIAVAQAALMAGKLEELEASVRHQQQLCDSLKAIRPETIRSFPVRDQNKLQVTAQQTRRQNQIFDAAMSRMRGHLATLRNLLHGPSLSYSPKSHKVPGREA